MKKPLHPGTQQFLLSSKGKLIGWGVADVKNLVFKANRAKVEKLKLDSNTMMNEAECIFIHEWFEMLAGNKLSKEVVDKLNFRIAHVWYHHILMRDLKGAPYWRHVANADRMHEPEVAIAYSVSHLLACGALDGLKCCALKDCQKYFIGRSNVKWCSKACGSLFRVRKKRKKEKS